LWRADRRPLMLAGLRDLGLRERIGRKRRVVVAEAEGRRRLFRGAFPQILDDYILRDFITYVGMILAAFIVLTLVFTFFELIGDILKNRVAMGTVGEYLLDVVPSMVYLMTPMSVLVGVLVTFGILSRSNEITAMKATGISIYRVVVPVLIISAVFAGALFTFDQLYLPRFNRRQETLRNRIKGKPPQTYLRPDRKWIFGEHSTIYYYEFFDAERGQFGNISVFAFDPSTFQIKTRVFAARAHWEPDLDKWIFEKGWVRRFNDVAIEDYHHFDVATFPELDEPPTYFRKEVKQSSEMSYEELKRYIHDLQQGGFDVVRLKVQLQKKIAFPLITLVMAVLAVPFSMSAGRRGALTGVATAIGIAVVYWVTAGLFEALGNVSQLPPILAAWSPDLLFALAGGYLILKVPT
jgi:LPS export ABC transporter permease LptG